MTDIDLKSPEIQAAIKAAVDEATSGLVNKRNELLDEVKKLRKSQEVDPADYQKLKEDISALEDKLTEAQKATKAALSENEKIKKAYESESAYTQRLLIETGLDSAFDSVNIKPELKKAAKALFVGQAQIKVEGENRSALIGDKSITDFVKEWAATDEGKHFVLAQNNSGGGANGGGGNSSSKVISSEQFNALAPKERAAHYANGGSVEG